jgi:RHS repeat-associated protein
MAASYRYDAYGNTVTASGSLAGANVYRFSSKELVTSGNLYYYGYRFYDPNLQRWLNRDPLGEPGFEVLRGDDTDVLGDGPNRYAFVQNSPVNYHDDDGLFLGGFKAWRCRKKMEKWEKECLKEIPPCTRGAGAGAGGPCPYDQPGQDPGNHYWVCEPKRVEKIADCAKKAKEMFEACMGAATSPPRPSRL